MSLAWSAPELAALTAGHVDLVWFVELNFDGGVVRLHSSLGTYNTLSNDWLGIGDLGSIGVMQESEGFSPYELTLELSGINDDIIAVALNESVFERRCVIYLGVIDPADGVSLIAAPKQRFAGSMQHMTVTVGEVNRVVLSVESEFKYFQEANGSRWTDEQQQSEFSGDQAFEYVPQLQDAKIQWGPGNVPVRFGAPSNGNPDTLTETITY